MTILWKATEQRFHVVLLLTYSVILTFSSVGHPIEFHCCLKNHLEQHLVPFNFQFDVILTELFVCGTIALILCVGICFVLPECL